MRSHHFTVEKFKVPLVLLLVGFAGYVFLFGARGAVDDNIDKEEVLIKLPSGKFEMPEELMKAYESFVRDTKDPTKERLFSHCLPRSVKVTLKARIEDLQDYGDDMNIPFLANRFEPKLRGGIKFNDDVYYLASLSSHFWFVRTKTKGWKIFRYGDNPH